LKTFLYELSNIENFIFENYMKTFLFENFSILKTFPYENKNLLKNVNYAFHLRFDINLIDFVIWTKCFGFMRGTPYYM